MWSNPKNVTIWNGIRRSPPVVCDSSCDEWPVCVAQVDETFGSAESPLNVARGGLREAHLSTEQSSSCQEARLPSPNEHPCRPGSVEGPPRQGSAPSVRLIWRIRERSAFTRIASDGRRARAGVLWCTYFLDPPNTATPPRVAFAFSRAFGPAVVRNRVRRQLRAMLRLAVSDGRLPPGEYLFGGKAAAAGRSSIELQFDLNQLLANLRA